MPDYLHDDDPALFEAFKAGDPAATDAIFLQYVRPLCFYVQRLTGSALVAEDIAADVFMKMLERRDQFDNLDNVRAYLYRSARNAAINVLRNDSRHRQAHQELAYLMKATEGSEGWHDNERLRAQVLGEIYAEIEQLPDRCREVFKAIFIQGLGYEEIATRMGINVQTVRNQKTRAINHLRSQLLKKGRPAALLCLVEWLLESHESAFSRFF